jgi:asparaginyl-tRNA synthetase
MEEEKTETSENLLQVVSDAQSVVMPCDKTCPSIHPSIHPLSHWHKIYAESPDLVIGHCTKFYGWIRRVRVGDNGSLVFIDIYDGTLVGEMKCVASIDHYIGSKYIDQYSKYDLPDAMESFKTLEFEQLSAATHLSPGCSVVVDGIIVKSPAKATQLFEMEVHRLRIIGNIEDHVTYPIHKTTEKHLTSLRKLPFMRMRAQAMQCIFRIASKLEFAIHSFMNDMGVTKIDPNILTMSDCEGAGETFTVSPQMFSKDDQGRHIPVGLTVSSQLPLEAAITGLKHVYTLQKSFRAEKSDTPKHLAEFPHLEYEGSFITFENLMKSAEDLVKYIVKFVHDKCSGDFDFLESKFAPDDLKPSREFLKECCAKKFCQIKHIDAVNLILHIVESQILLPDDSGKLKRVKLTKLPQHGEDLGSEHEKLLVKYFGWIECTEEERQTKLKEGKEFGAFVFLTHWPLKIKSFYMKQCDDDSGECESFDLLCPRFGEVFGGSMREWRFQKLSEEIARRKMDLRPIQWFLDLRKSGSMPHGGYGMGVSRLTALLIGAPSVRDVVFLPVYFEHCPY